MKKKKGAISVMDPRETVLSWSTIVIRWMSCEGKGFILGWGLYCLALLSKADVFKYICSEPLTLLILGVVGQHIGRTSLFQLNVTK